MNASARVIVALDFDNSAEAMHLVEQLGSSAEFYKVGLQLLTAEGPALVRQLIAQEKQVFLDLKLFEIPNSVAGAVTAAGQLGVSMVTVHASGGSAVLRAAVEAARPFPQLKVLALTVITSMSDQDLHAVGVSATVAEQVVRLTRLSMDAGCHGVVASPKEARLLRELLPESALIITPGTQLPGDAKNDQVRTATPAEAIQAGSTHLVIGRSIARAQAPAATFVAICSQIENAVAAEQRITPNPSFERTPNGAPQFEG
ncbi:MAG: orotidine-5'-phosphate decarboxylase [Burkholderiales bacterium]|jgi:orotidine-5'-phosphate decarboxylase